MLKIRIIYNMIGLIHFIFKIVFTKYNFTVKNVKTQLLINNTRLKKKKKKLSRWMIRFNIEYAYKLFLISVNEL